LWLRAEKNRKTLELGLSEVLMMKSYKELQWSKSFAVKANIAFRRESRKNYQKKLNMNCKVLGHIRSGERTKHEKCRSSAAMSWSKAAIVVEGEGRVRPMGRGNKPGGGGVGDVKWGQAFGTWPGGLGPPFSSTTVSWVAREREWELNSGTISLWIWWWILVTVFRNYIGDSLGGVGVFRISGIFILVLWYQKMEEFFQIFSKISWIYSRKNIFQKFPSFFLSKQLQNGKNIIGWDQLILRLIFISEKENWAGMGPGGIHDWEIVNDRFGNKLR
jgi:hypothetical protein